MIIKGKGRWLLETNTSTKFAESVKILIEDEKYVRACHSLTKRKSKGMI